MGRGVHVPIGSKCHLLAMAVVTMLVLMTMAQLAAPAAGGAQPLIPPTDPVVDIDGEIELADFADGNGTWNDPYIIEGLTINTTGTSNINAIDIAGTHSHLLIRDCAVESGSSSTHVYDGNGIHLQNCWNVTIENVTAEHNTVSGIMLDNSNNITVLDCHSGLNGIGTTGTYGNGIMVQTCHDVMVSNCSLYGSRTSGVIFYKNYDVDPSVNVTISGCHIEGNAVGVRDQGNLLDDLIVENCTISDYSYAGIFMNTNYGDRKTGWIIKDNVFENDDQMSIQGALDIDGLTGAIIERNGITNTYSSHDNQIIYLSNCDNTTVRDCTVVDNIGIPFQSVSSQNITFSDSLLFNCTQAGVKVGNSVDIIVEGLDISGSADDGIRVTDSMRVLIEGCEIADNTGDGIYVTEDPNTGIDFYDLRIINCTVERNNYGVYISTHANFVTVVNNSFIDNNATFLAYTDLQARDDGINCTWNSSEGGNHWSDWTGPDEDYDGFVDSPYDIYGSAGAQDLLPIADPEDVPPIMRITSPSDGTTLTTTEVTVEWQAWDNQTGLDRYEVTVDSDSPVDVGLNESIDLSLSEGGHDVTVTAFDTVGNEGSDSVSFSIVLPTVPGTPTDLTATPSNSTILLGWDAPSDGGSPIISYHVYRGLDAGSLSEIGTSASTSYQDGGLTNGVTYYYAASAENAVGEGASSAVVNATPAALPDAPTLLTLEAEGLSITLEWAVPEDGGFAIEHYNVYRSDDGGTATMIGQPTIANYTDGDLAYGINYTYTVSAVNGVGEGSMSDPASMTLLTVPGIPGSLAIAINGTALELTWEAPKEDGGAAIDGYSVYRCLDGNLTLLANVTSTMMLDDDVIPGIPYGYTVLAFNSQGNGAMTEIVNGTLVLVPGAPVGLDVSMEDGNVVLTWDAPVDDGGDTIEGYVIHYGASPDHLSLSCGVDGTEHAFSGAPGTYYFAVAAVNGMGEGTLSDVVSVTVVTAPSAPTSLEGTSGDDGVELTWSAPSDNGGSDVLSYNIYRSEGDGESSLLTSTNDTEYLDPSVEDDATYHYLVRAVNSEGEGAASLDVVVEVLSENTGDDGLVWYLYVIPLLVIVLIVAALIFLKRRGDEGKRED